MKLLDEAKQFFWLRRIAIASERNAAAIERLAKIVELEYQLAQHPKPPRKKAEMALMDQEEINKQYLRYLEAGQQGIELDE